MTAFCSGATREANGSSRHTMLSYPCNMWFDVKFGRLHLYNVPWRIRWALEYALRSTLHMAKVGTPHKNGYRAAIPLLMALLNALLVQHYLQSLLLLSPMTTINVLRRPAPKPNHMTPIISIYPWEVSGAQPGLYIWRCWLGETWMVMLYAHHFADWDWHRLIDEALEECSHAADQEWELRCAGSACKSFSVLLTNTIRKCDMFH